MLLNTVLKFDSNVELGIFYRAVYITKRIYETYASIRSVAKDISKAGKEDKIVPSTHCGYLCLMAIMNKELWESYTSNFRSNSDTDYTSDKERFSLEVLSNVSSTPEIQDNLQRLYGKLSVLRKINKSTIGHDELHVFGSDVRNDGSSLKKSLQMLPQEVNYQSFLRSPTGILRLRAPYNQMGNFEEMNDEFSEVHNNPKKGKRFHGSIRLALVDEDETALNALDLFMRFSLICFSVNVPERDILILGDTKPAIGQVGLCCAYCSHLDIQSRNASSYFFPDSIVNLKHNIDKWRQDMRHFDICKEIPLCIQSHFKSLESCKYSSAMNLLTEKYYQAAANQLGLMDCERGGIYFCQPIDEIAHEDENGDDLSSISSITSYISSINSDDEDWTTNDDIELCCPNSFENETSQGWESFHVKVKNYTEWGIFVSPVLCPEHTTSNHMLTQCHGLSVIDILQCSSLNGLGLKYGDIIYEINGIYLESECWSKVIQTLSREIQHVYHIRFRRPLRRDQNCTQYNKKMLAIPKCVKVMSEKMLSTNVDNMLAQLTQNRDGKFNILHTGSIDFIPETQYISCKVDHKTSEKDTDHPPYDIIQPTLTSIENDPIENTNDYKTQATKDFPPNGSQVDSGLFDFIPKLQYISYEIDENIAGKDTEHTRNVINKPTSISVENDPIENANNDKKQADQDYVSNVTRPLYKDCLKMKEAAAILGDTQLKLVELNKVQEDVNVSTIPYERKNGIELQQDATIRHINSKKELYMKTDKDNKIIKETHCSQNVPVDESLFQTPLQAKQKNTTVSSNSVSQRRNKRKHSSEMKSNEKLSQPCNIVSDGMFVEYSNDHNGTWYSEK